MPPRRGSLKRGLTERFHLLSAGSIDLPTRQSGTSSLSVSIQTVSRLNERELIARIQSALRPRHDIMIGIGDDAAVFAARRNRALVTTTDMLFEGVHFRREWSSASDIGAKAIAVNVSDLGAMGAEPRLALLSLALPPEFPVADLDALIAGVNEAAREADLAVAGGNLTRSTGPLIVDVTAIGDVHARKVLERGHAGAGDEVYVTGTIGAGAAGLAWLEQHGVPDSSHPAWPAVRRACRPRPPLRAGMALSRASASRTAIDLSDGLADGIRRIAEASGVGFTIDASALPIDPAARWVFEQLGMDPVRAALAGGDDYELLFTVPARRRGRFRAARTHMGTDVTRIGTVSAGGLTVDGAAGIDLGSLGFDHFEPPAAP